MLTVSFVIIPLFWYLVVVILGIFWVIRSKYVCSCFFFKCFLCSTHYLILCWCPGKHSLLFELCPVIFLFFLFSIFAQFLLMIILNLSSTLVGNIIVLFLVTTFSPVQNTLSEEAVEAGMASTALAMWAKMGRTFRCFFSSHNPWFKIYELLFGHAVRLWKLKHTWLCHIWFEKKIILFYLCLSVSRKTMEFFKTNFRYMKPLHTRDTDFLNAEGPID